MLLDLWFDGVFGAWEDDGEGCSVGVGIGGRSWRIVLRVGLQGSLLWFPLPSDDLINLHFAMHVNAIHSRVCPRLIALLLL